VSDPAILTSLSDLLVVPGVAEDVSTVADS